MIEKVRSYLKKQGYRLISEKKEYGELKQVWKMGGSEIVINEAL